MLGCFSPSSSSNPYSALNPHRPIVGIPKIKPRCTVAVVSSCALRCKLLQISLSSRVKYFMWVRIVTVFANVVSAINREISSFSMHCPLLTH